MKRRWQLADGTFDCSRPPGRKLSGKASAAGRRIGTAANAVNDLYRIYLTAQRDGVGFNLAYLEDEFTVPYKGPFDKEYMNTLFDYGYRKGSAGYDWKKLPPGYEN